MSTLRIKFLPLTAFYIGWYRFEVVCWRFDQVLTIGEFPGDFSITVIQGNCYLNMKQIGESVFSISSETHGRTTRIRKPGGLVSFALPFLLYIL